MEFTQILFNDQNLLAQLLVIMSEEVAGLGEESLKATRGTQLDLLWPIEMKKLDMESSGHSQRFKKARLFVLV